MRIDTKKNNFGMEAKTEDMALNPKQGYVLWGPTHSRSISTPGNKDNCVHHLLEWSLFYERFRVFAEMVGHQRSLDKEVTTSRYHLSHRLKKKILEDTTKHQMLQSIIIACNVDSAFPDHEEQYQLDLTKCLQNLRLRSKDDENNVRNFFKCSEEDFDITDSLHNIRSFRNLLQRAIVLSSFDSLDQEGTREWMVASGTDTNVLLKDLHLDDLTILPSTILQSRVASFQSIFLYSDVHRRIRLHHIYKNQAETPEFPHNHYGDSASIIMAGKMVNQFISLKEVDNTTRNQIELEKLRLELESSTLAAKQTGLEYLKKGIFGHRKIERDEQSKLKSNLFQKYVQASVISSHAYHKGDHYLLPKDDYHRITGSAVTLFAQAYKNKNTKGTTSYIKTSYTTETVTAPHEMERSLGDNSVVDTLAIEQLLKGIQMKAYDTKKTIY